MNVKDLLTPPPPPVPYGIQLRDYRIINQASMSLTLPVAELTCVHLTADGTDPEAAREQMIAGLERLKVLFAAECDLAIEAVRNAEVRT